MVSVVLKLGERRSSTKKKIALGIMLLLLAMSTLTFSIQSVKAEKDKVVVGWAHPLSGPAGTICALHHAYYKMIIEDYNVKGGLYVPEYGKRLPIEYIEYDNEFDIDKTIRLYEKLITEDQVDLLFGPWGFGAAVLPLFEQYKYPVVGLVVGGNTISDLLRRGVYRYLFLTLGQPREVAEELVELFSYINEEVATPGEGIDTVGITYRADEHGVEHATAMKEEFTAIGIEVPVFESYNALSPPLWTLIINAFRDADVDVAIFIGYSEGATFVQQVKAADYNPKLLFIGPNMEAPFFLYDVFGFTYGEMAGIAYYDGFPAVNYGETPELEVWAQQHRQRLGYLPLPGSAVFYAGLECLFLAVEKYDLDREAIRDALETEQFDTLLGKFKFRPGQSPQVEIGGTLAQWQGGEMMEVIWPLDAASADVIYPKFPWYWALMPDIKRDGTINIEDVFLLAQAFDSDPEHPRWNPAADVHRDDVINILDVFIIAQNFGATVQYD